MADTVKDNKIQILRAIAIISVVVVHTCPAGMAEVLCRPFFNHAVAIFVFLSGYLTREQGGQWLSFYRRRIGRVLIPYLIWSVLYTLPSKILILSLLAVAGFSKLAGPRITRWLGLA